MDGLAGTIDGPVLSSAGIEQLNSAPHVAPVQVTSLFPPSKKGRFANGRPV